MSTPMQLLVLYCLITLGAMFAGMLLSGAMTSPYVRAKLMYIFITGDVYIGTITYACIYYTRYYSDSVDMLMVMTLVYMVYVTSQQTRLYNLRAARQATPDSD